MNLIALDFSELFEKAHIYNHFQEHLVRIVAGIQVIELNKKMKKNVRSVRKYRHIKRRR